MGHGGGAPPPQSPSAPACYSQVRRRPSRAHYRETWLAVPVSLHYQSVQSTVYHLPTLPPTPTPTWHLPAVRLPSSPPSAQHPPPPPLPIRLSTLILLLLLFTPPTPHSPSHLVATQTPLLLPSHTLVHFQCSPTSPSLLRPRMKFPTIHSCRVSQSFQQAT